MNSFFKSMEINIQEYNEIDSFFKGERLKKDNRRFGHILTEENKLLLKFKNVKLKFKNSKLINFIQNNEYNLILDKQNNRLNNLLNQL